MDKETKSNVIFVGIILAAVGGLIFGWSDIQWFRLDSEVRVLLSTEGIGTHPAAETIAKLEDRLAAKAAEFGFNEVQVAVGFEKRASSLGTTFWYIVAKITAGPRVITRELQLDREDYVDDLDMLEEAGVEVTR